MSRPAVLSLWCRCGTDKTPIPCVGGCGYLCQLIPGRRFPGFSQSQIAAGLTVPATATPPRDVRAAAARETEE